MNTLIRQGEWGFDWILETTWQAAVLVGLILLVQWLLRNRLSPAWRYGLWMLLVVRLMMPALPQSPVSVFNVTRSEPANKIAEFVSMPVAEVPTEANTATALSEAPVFDPFLPNQSQDASVSINVPRAPSPEAGTQEQIPSVQTTSNEVNGYLVAFALWFAGVAVLGLRLIRANTRFLAHLRNRVPVKDQRILRLFETCRTQIKVRQPVTLIETEAVEAPAVYGLWRKRLLLPDGIFERFSDMELRYIFLHELAHLKRRDLEVNWLTSLLQILHWFNPIIWFAFARMRADRELATDALALSHGSVNESTRYGDTIIKLLDTLNLKPALPELVGILENKSQITNRLRNISSFGIRKHWRSVAFVTTLAVAGLTLTTAIEGQDDSEIISEGSRKFELQVQDYDTSEPVSDISVRFDLEYYDGRFVTLSETTDDEGLASIEFDDEDISRFFYRAESNDYLTIEGEWVKQQAAHLPQVFEIKPKKGEIIGGIVVDQNDNPIANAEVYNDRGYTLLIGGSQPDSAQTWKSVAGKLLAVTDSGGRWSSRDAWNSPVYLRIRHPDFADAVYSTRTTKAMEAENKGHAIDREALSDQSMQFMLTSGFSITGLVVDEFGAPSANIQVRSGETTEEARFLPGHRWEHITVTDAQGRFQFDHLSERQHYFTVQAQGYAPAAIAWSSLSSPSELELHMNRGGVTSGRVVDHEGHPVEDVEITFLDWSIWRGIEWHTRTDTNGNFEWNNAPFDPYRVKFEKDGYIYQERNLQGGNSREITLQPALTIAGKISDAETESPVENFIIAWSSSLSGWERNPKIAVSDPSGEYILDLGRIESGYWAHGYPNEFIFRVEAEGYTPKTSRGFSNREGDVGTLEFNFELEPADPIIGTIIDAIGIPVEGAEVTLNSPIQQVLIDGTPKFSHFDSDTHDVTDAQGRFSIFDSYDPDGETLDRSPFPESEKETRYLVAVHEKGIGWLPLEDMAPDASITLQAWASIEGTAFQYDELLDDVEITLNATAVGGFESEIRAFQQTITDEDGNFTFELLPPTKAQISRMIPMPPRGASSLNKTVSLSSGETSVAQFGGEGRPIIGKVEITNYHLPVDWRKDTDFPRVITSSPKRPENITTQEEYDAWRQSEEIRKLFDNIKNYPVVFNEDGTFRIDEVVPGNYQFSFRIYDPRDPEAMAYSNYLASFNGSFNAPDDENANSRIPYDAGTFQIEVERPIAPDFTAEDMEGNEFKLSDFKGKYVFLDFWATWCAPCIADLPYLRNAHEKYKDREDFVMLSLSFDNTVEHAQRFIEQNNTEWDQGYLGPYDEYNQDGYYKRGIPAMFVIDPEGNVISENFEGTDIERVLSRILNDEFL